MDESSRKVVRLSHEHNGRSEPVIVLTKKKERKKKGRLGWIVGYNNIKSL